MTIKEAKEKRDELRKQLANLLLEFERETGLTVEAITIEREWVLSGGRHSVPAYIKLDIGLEEVE